MLLERTSRATIQSDKIPLRPTSIRTLDHLKHWHRRLLRLSQSYDEAKALSSEAAEFMREGSALGAMLDLPRQREEAQAMLDYWAATCSIALAEQGKLSFTNGQAMHSPVLASFDQTSVKRLVEIADQSLQRMNQEEKELARRMFLRLTQLSADGKTQLRNQVFRDELLSLGDQAKCNAILRDLLALGVLRESSLGSSDLESTDSALQGQIEISKDAMLREWPTLREWLDRRLKFRRAAEFWRDHDKDETALFDSGPLLAETESYRDLGELEREFALASREKYAQAAVREAELAKREMAIARDEAEAQRATAQAAARETELIKRQAAIARDEAEAQRTNVAKLSGLAVCLVAVLLIMGALILKLRETITTRDRALGNISDAMRNQNEAIRKQAQADDAALQAMRDALAAIENSQKANALLAEAAANSRNASEDQLKAAIRSNGLQAAEIKNRVDRNASAFGERGKF